MRIGELSRRTGVSPELLRAWEQRYGLLRPTRSPGGFRLYSVDDEARVRRTTALLEDGLSTAEAARAASVEPPAAPPAADAAAPPPAAVTELVAELDRAVLRFDGAAAHGALDRVLGAVSVEYALTEVLIPYLRGIGDRWATGEVSVAQEHFASNLVRGRLLGLARGWPGGGPSSAVLACLPGEDHDLGLVLLHVLLARRGWRVTFLGADTPVDTLAVTARQLQPTLVVLTTYDAAVFREHAAAVAGLTEVAPVGGAGPGRRRRDRGHRSPAAAPRHRRGRGHAGGRLTGGSQPASSIRRRNRRVRSSRGSVSTSGPPRSAITPWSRNSTWSAT
ncbi:MerR family transcriptional regulator [Nocardioides sp. TF02-7]|uniref:MerR family transcriptional regulator n=1 Tax=Nocardioides sp. TF02-7 TaxID=2917724 RepID=UPI0023DB9961|nr:MerR family transcriptional regulator [Nocardioides sp. TF02-7]